MKTDTKNTAPCKTCENGIMHRKKTYVLGVGGAILRFFFMIPGVLLLLTALFGLIGSGGAVGASAQMKQEQIEKLRVSYEQKGLPPALVEATLETGRYQTDGRSLTSREEWLIHELQNDYANVQFDELMMDGAAAFAGGMSIFIACLGLIAMAFGFIIGIRKWKLVCQHCGTSINAA